MPARKVGSGFEEVLEDVSTACGRLAKSQLVHVCAGSPAPLSKVPGQVPSAFNFVCGALEQGDQQIPVLSTDVGRAVNEPEAIDPESGLGQSPNKPEALRKTLPKNNTLLKIDSDSSESSTPPVGRWRRSIPKS